MVIHFVTITTANGMDHEVGSFEWKTIFDTIHPGDVLGSGVVPAQAPSSTYSAPASTANVVSITGDVVERLLQTWNSYILLVSVHRVCEAALAAW